MMSLWRISVRRVGCQLARPGRWALVGSECQTNSQRLFRRRCDIGRWWTRGVVWRQMWRNLWLAVCARKGRRPNVRVLLCGAVTFLWDRERISNEEVVRCLKEYDDRMNTQLHVALERSPPPSVPAEPDQVRDSQSCVSQFKQELQSILEESSERQLAQLPLVGLTEAGPVSRFSMKAFSAIQRVKLKAASRMDEAKSHVVTEVHSKWTLMMSNLRTNAKRESSTSRGDDEAEEDGDGVDICSLLPPEDDFGSTSAVEVLEKTEEKVLAIDTPGSDVSSEKTPFIEAALSYYEEHSKRHMLELPLVGLRPNGHTLTFSHKIGSWGRRVLAEASHLQNQVSLLAHLGYTLFDVPTLTPLPLPTLMGAGLLDHGLEELAASPVSDLLLRICRQGQSLLNTSPEVILAAFDVMLGHEIELNSPSLGNKEEGHIWRRGHTVELALRSDLQPCEATTQSGISSQQQATEECGKHITTDTYLSQCGWEHFADAHNCTVYRTPHEDAGLYMYKVIGTYTDISAQEFLDVQVDHECRKSWDSYVQRLETIDMDPISGSEVVHWVMRFPFPMSSREYVYVRRVWASKNAAVLINRSVDHPAAPKGKKYVRVNSYISEMVMHPHVGMEEMGFDFELTYFDDPQTNLPSSCVNWVATAAMPDFLAQIHVAALERRKTYTRSGVALSPF